MPPTSQHRKFVRPLDDHVGAIFRSWARFGRILRLLLRLLSLLAGFCASWDAPGSILEGISWTLLGASWLPNAVQEGPGLDFGGFWERPGRVSEVPRMYFSRFFRTFRYIMVLIVQ